MDGAGDCAVGGGLGMTLFAGGVRARGNGGSPEGSARRALL